MSPLPRGPIEQLKDLAAVQREHMTDEELTCSKLWTDSMMYGFCVIDAEGNRIDPRTVLPVSDA